MDSRITETPRMTDSPRSVAIPFNIEGLNESNMCDLNKVFQINFTYNVDLLKSLLEGILKFQKSTEEEIEALKEENKEKNLRIRRLESKIGKGQITIPSSNEIKISVNEDDKKEEKKTKKVESIFVPENKNENKGKKIIHDPKDEKNILETSDSNTDILNRIIVSNNNLKYIYLIIREK